VDVIGNISQFWRLTRELDIAALRSDFERPATLRVVGSSRAAAERVARLLDPTAELDSASISVLGVDHPPPADVYVVAMDASPLDPGARRSLNQLSLEEAPMLLARLDSAAEVLVLGLPEERVVDLPPGEDLGVARDRLLAALVRSAPRVMLPLGRRHPALREAVARHLIRDTARANAQFAAVSSLPASIPLVGGVVGDMADMLVLTKNQVLLLFKLAGLYGRDLSLGRQLIAEVLPVVGGGFVWRSTARALVGLLPTPLSLLPKTAVAYTGTYVVGETARYYYEHGRRPPQEQVRQLQAEGQRLAQAVLGRLRR
jgi:uncharacterized protein (DUF697 family)